MKQAHRMPPRMLELFSGENASLSKAFAALGWECHTLDFNKKLVPPPTYCIDILEWDYKAFPRDYFRHVHASPDCRMYSRCRTVGHRDLFSADCWSQRAADIIKYFAPAASYSVENPALGKYTLEKRGIMDEFTHHLVSYCKFESPHHPYKKDTSIWCDLPVVFPGPCRKGDRCSIYNEALNQHPTTAQRGGAKFRRPGHTFYENDISHRLEVLHSLPPRLCAEIARAATQRVLLEPQPQAPASLD